MLKFCVTAISALLISFPVFAGQADVVAVKALKTGDTWRFDVTVRHDDSGWDHYADGWRIFAPDGTELGYRELLHPHENEQPFTRSLSGVKIPPGISNVTIRSHDSQHGWGGKEVSVKLR